MLEESLSSNEYKPEDAYEPEAALEDEQTNVGYARLGNDLSFVAILKLKWVHFILKKL